LKQKTENEEIEITKPKKKKAVTNSRKTILKKIVEILKDKKCEEITVLDLEKVNTYLSVFIICTVKTNIQGNAAARELERSMKELKLGRGNQDKKGVSADNGWTLLDFGEIIIHIMTPEKRNFYDLEKLWGDAEPIAT
jgi:ribosome-associated protein